MKGTATLLQDQEIDVIQLSSPEHGPVAIVNLDVMRNLLHAHAQVISLKEMKEKMIERIANCATEKEYKAALSYDLAILSLHDALREYDDAAWKEREAKLGRQTPMDK